MSINRLKFLILLLVVVLSVGAVGQTPKRCPARVAYQEDLEAPFIGPWSHPDLFLSHFKPFKNILMLADGEELYDAYQVAKRYPSKRVVGTDLTIAPNFIAPPNLEVMTLNLRKKFPFKQGSFDLVYLASGLCHCDTPTSACCGIRRTDKAIAHFFTQVIAMLDKKAPHSLAILNGLMDPDVYLEWESVCMRIASKQGFRCVPQVHFNTGYHSDFWGFKIRR
jgi:hypothetical protein